MRKAAFQVALNLLAIFVAEAVVREGVRFVTRRRQKC